MLKLLRQIFSTPHTLREGPNVLPKLQQQRAHRNANILVDKGAGDFTAYAATAAKLPAACWSMIFVSGLRRWVNSIIGMIGLVSS